MKISVSDNLRKIYENYHESGETEWRRIAAKDKVAHIIEVCRNIKHDKIIEIGAGDGAVLAELDGAKFAREMYALEIANSAVDTISKRNWSCFVECKLFDGYNIPYGDKQFDLAILTHVIEHVEHPVLLLKEVKRIAKNIFIECPLEYNIQGKRDHQQSIKYGHINYYNQFLLSKLLQNAGFEIVKTQTYNPSLAFYRYYSGKKAWIKYMIKKTVLKTWPGLATRLFIYFYAVLCR